MVRSFVARILGREEEEWVPAPVTRTAPLRSVSSPFAAVTIIPGAPCCEGAAELRGKRLLTASAPMLPLARCTNQERCRCRFQKHADRREEDDRRIAGLLQMSAWYAGNEKRAKRGRRSTDR